ncbi:hypothetical protein ACHAWC_000834, partial [Mediolabrus comicus]
RPTRNPTRRPTRNPTKKPSPQKVGTGYCTFSPNTDCWKSGWPKCCKGGQSNCPKQQPACDITPQKVGSYCTGSPNWSCYLEGWPPCCFNGESCPSSYKKA